MDWLSSNHVSLNYFDKSVVFDDSGVRRGTSALEPLMKARRRFELEKKRRTGKQDVLREEEKNERNGA